MSERPKEQINKRDLKGINLVPEGLEEVKGVSGKVSCDVMETNDYGEKNDNNEVIVLLMDESEMDQTSVLEDYFIMDDEEEEAILNAIRTSEYRCKRILLMSHLNQLANGNLLERNRISKNRSKDGREREMLSKWLKKLSEAAEGIGYQAVSKISADREEVETCLETGFHILDELSEEYQERFKDIRDNADVNEICLVYLIDPQKREEIKVDMSKRRTLIEDLINGFDQGGLSVEDEDDDDDDSGNPPPVLH